MLKKYLGEYEFAFIFMAGFLIVPIIIAFIPQVIEYYFNDLFSGLTRLLGTIACIIVGVIIIDD